LRNVPIASDLVDFALLWSAVTDGRSKAVLVRTPGYELLYPEAERELEATLRRLVTNVQINENTYFYRAQTWLNDIFQNLPSAVGTTPFMALEDRYRGVPAFIVGAGPSLDKNGALLAEAAKKGIVIAVNTSAPALARLGVVPQVLACIESIDLSSSITGVPFIDDVVRAFSLSGHPSHLTSGKGPLLPIFENISSFEPLVRLFGHRGLPVGASVTTAAFSLADRLGCDPIVLVGQDLAFTENQIYARGTAYEGSTVSVARADNRVDMRWAAAAEAAHGTRHGALPRAEPLVEATAWGGQSVVSTAPSLAAVKAWLETAATVILRGRKDRRLINATEGGARVDGFEEISLARLLASLPYRAITAADIAGAAKGTGMALSAERLREWGLEQRDRAAHVEAAAIALGALVKRAVGEVAGEDSAAISRTFSELERAEQGLRQASAGQPFVDAWSCAALQAIEGKAGKTPLENSSRAHALHALRTEADIAAIISRSAAEITDHFTVLINDTEQHNQHKGLPH
jgi:hypothetical protein